MDKTAYAGLNRRTSFAYRYFIFSDSEITKSVCLWFQWRIQALCLGPSLSLITPFFSSSLCTVDVSFLVFFLLSWGLTYLFSSIMHKEMCMDIHFTLLEAIECEILSELKVG